MNEVDPSERDIAMVFQNYALYPHMNVYNNLAYGLKNRGIDKQAIEQKVNDAAKLLQISDYLQRKPSMLSGGQRQRIAIARSIILQPAFMILDEPTSALDRSIQIQIIDLLKKIQNKYELTYLFISHDLKVIRSVSDSIFVMQDGNLVESGKANEVFDNPKKEYTNKLLTAALKYATN